MLIITFDNGIDIVKKLSFCYDTNNAMSYVFNSLKFLLKLKILLAQFQSTSRAHNNQIWSQKDFYM